MNNTLFPELTEIRIELDDDVRDEQFAAIVAALGEVPAAQPSPLVRARAAWRRWTVTLAAAATGLVPVAAAASESAVPGDALYPIKLTVERVQVLFDSDIVAEHRVDELETLVIDGAGRDAIEEHINETLDVLSDRPHRDDLTDRAVIAIDRYRDEHVTDADVIDEHVSDRVTDEESPVRPTDEATTTTEPAHNDRVDTTTTTVVDEQTSTTVREADRTTTTTAPRGDGAGDGDGDRTDADGDGHDAGGDQP